MNNPLARFLLQDGTEYNGYHFGAPLSAAGEAVFSTAMTGYTESLTDPSYKGQLLVYTYPLIGNYGIPSERKLENIDEFYESNKIHINALIISDYSHDPYHWNMAYKLSHWLKKNNVPGIYGIDTRTLTQKLREQGTMLGKIIVNNDIPFYDPNIENLAAQVCIVDKTVYGNGKYKVLLVDCGVKNNILRCLLRRNCTITRVPWDYDFTCEIYDGLFLSNGPGNPKTYQKTIKHVQYALTEDRPIFGICLGNQLLGLAAGGDTYKLKYGHRSHNQPVLLKGSERAYITSQNHSYVLNEKSLPPVWNVLFKNLNDGSCEGLLHESKPFFSAQFHPEASGGPADTEFLFDWFIERMEKYKAKTPH
ncbi:glutamine-hydrolyzing carbamoyl-phosphate synthase small subunit [Bacteroidetes bacterium endosymbiont of Geopemphigus sp.]|uniref:glutamine-hydrolyzing carbamoyl-phosphate synthase small subunit n=1 Tax=Bacteroidetes bacterium endosymbiont of Geopemphigus sp. TaxID=2047937 RepID=UPI000CD2BAFD|nr:glutamine-hydrolyzing carbamoyl-phosphate synthase small subunit [Bacteroidetes bacterium endosymbiont of Geopemphigus sp.]